jgi:hypothetical protein
MYTVDGQDLKTTGKGTIEIYLPNQGILLKVTLYDVYHVPNMMTTLISVACLDKAGYFAHFDQGLCHIKAQDNNIIAEIAFQHGLYALCRCKPSGNVALMATQKLTLAQAHRVMGHNHFQAIV